MKPMIYIDADACPVKAEAEEIAIRHGLSLVLVTNGGIRPSTNPLVRLVIVGDGPDMADRHIADHVSSGDIVVTSDIPLALFPTALPAPMDRSVSATSVLD
mgnify:CR=1 FL=1